MSELIVAAKDINVSGMIKINKTNNDKIVVSESAISEKITCKQKSEIVFNSKEQIIDKIDTVYYGLCFTSLFIGVDMFDNKHYDENDDNFKTVYIPGINSVYEKPAGVVCYHSDNEWLFKCLVIECICNDQIVPLTYTNIDENKLYSVVRSDGTIQKCSLGSNKSLSINQDKIVIVNYFNKNIDEKVIPGLYTELCKGVDIKKFNSANNIILKINLPYFNDDELNTEDNITKDTMIHYNEKLKNTEKIIQKILCYE